MSSLDRYTSSKVSDEACQGEKFAPDGFPYPCDDTRVFELSHSNGRKLYICEYHN